jgi:hypothetical protein
MRKITAGIGVEDIHEAGPPVIGNVTGNTLAGAGNRMMS